MAKITPKFNVKVEFAFKELFDPNDPLSQWIINLSRAVSDLLLANRRLEEGLEQQVSRHEIIYDIRAVATHVWELTEFLRKTNSLVVDAFLARLIDEAREEYEKAMAALQAPAAGDSAATKSFKATLASARDQASHYSEIDHKLLRRAIEHLCEDNEDGTPHIGTVFIGDTFKDYYSQFASELDYQLFCLIEGEDMEPLKKFVMQLNELTASLIKFATTAINTFLSEHNDQLKITKLD